MKFIFSTFFCLAIFTSQDAIPQELLPDLGIEVDRNGSGEATEAITDPETKIFTVVIENDSIGGKGTDENYTSGVRLSYFDTTAEMPALAYQVDDYIPTFEINSSSSVFYSFGQNLYTPSEVSQSTQDPDDRPWAAHLYISMGLVTITESHLDEVEVSIGVVGPWALGKQTQSFVHKYITPDSPDPKGWSNQLDNEPAFLVGWQRQYPQFLKASWGGLSLSTTPHYGITLGNVYTFANTGFSVSLSPHDEVWEDTPIRVRPAIPGTGFFEGLQNSWSWLVFAGIDGRAVARNIFLDGNTFSDSHSVDKNYFVMDANAGVAFTYGKYRVSYTFVYRTKEFKGQDDPSLFGALSFGYQF
jgi:lipid A 3-O-deacylase